MKLFVNFLTLKAAIHWMTPSRPGEFSFNKEKLEDRIGAHRMNNLIPVGVSLIDVQKVR